MKTKKDGKNILPRLKVWLLMGRTITHNQCQEMWGSNRLAAYIYRLKWNHGMDIEMTMVHDGIDDYGVYKLKMSRKKVKRLKTSS